MYSSFELKYSIVKCIELINDKLFTVLRLELTMISNGSKN